VEIFAIWGTGSHPRAPIGVKFCSAKQTHVPLGCAKFHMNQRNESPLQGENAEMPLSKFNTSSLPLCGILPVMREQHDITARRPYYSTVHIGHFIWPITKTLWFP